MKRKTLMTISIVSIIIIILLMLGLTYGFYQIYLEDNKSDKSIDIVTGNSKVRFIDLSTSDTFGIIEPGFENVKSFTVENIGNISATYSIYLVDVVNNFIRTDDITYNLYKKEGNFTNVTIESDLSDWTRVNTTENMIFPSEMSVIAENEKIETPGDIYTYVLKVEYIDHISENQNEDQGKILAFKVNVRATDSEINPFGEGTLAYNILENSYKSLNGTTYRDTPLTKPAEEISSYGTGKYEKKIDYYFTSWEEGEYEWEGLTYGPTQSQANGEPDEIAEGTDPVEACNSVIGQYISDYYGCNYSGCDSIGKVVACDEEGIPTLEENEDYLSWEEGEYEWDYLTYGSTQANANGEPDEIAEGTDPVEACNSVIGQYISDYSGCNYSGCDSIGKVVACDEEGIPTLEENYYWHQEEILEPEKTLSVTPDDYGISYYFRGDVKDNYLTFADMCWRIVRIAGDGSVKLILEDQNQPCGTSINGDWGIPIEINGTDNTGIYGYTSYPAGSLTASNGQTNRSTVNSIEYLNGQTKSNIAMATAFKNFQSTFTETELSKLKSGNWCLGDAGYSRTYSSNSGYTYTLLNEMQKIDYKIAWKTFYYDSFVRLSGENKDGVQPTLKCNGTKMNDWDDAETNPTSMFVGAITADEIAFAGGKYKTNNPNYYLINNNFKNSESDYFYFWSLSPYYSTPQIIFSFLMGGRGTLDYHYAYSESFGSSGIAFRPSVSIKPGTIIKESGEGTLESPYVIE